MILEAAAALFLLVALANVCFWPGIGTQTDQASVAILIPARNEEANLAACLESALATSATEILVYDDHSTDATAFIASRSRDPRVRLIHPRNLPAGWTGKTFACHTLATEAASTWLLFLDADARFTHDAPPRIVAEAAKRNVTFLSCWPGIDMHSFAERLLMPMLNFVTFSVFPGPLSLTNNMPDLGIAHGACIATHRETYLKLGGHALIRNEIFEDTMLAKAWRAAGERGLCLDGQSLIRVRMYQDFTGIWNGFQKNFYPAFRHTISFFAFLLLHLIVFLLPFIKEAWTAAALVLATRLILAIRFRHPLWSVLFHPVAEAILIALGLVSFWRCITGRGVSWKGRVYQP